MHQQLHKIQSPSGWKANISLKWQGLQLSSAKHPSPGCRRRHSLTCNADVGFAALGGACGAPGHALAPVILRPEELLHLLPGNLDADLPHNQTCQGARNTGQCWLTDGHKMSVVAEICSQSCWETLQLSTNIYSATRAVIRIGNERNSHFICIMRDVGD